MCALRGLSAICQRWIMIYLKVALSRLQICRVIHSADLLNLRDTRHLH